jgi:hypothetical protein
MESVLAVTSDSWPSRCLFLACLVAAVPKLAGSIRKFFEVRREISVKKEDQ